MNYLSIVSAVLLIVFLTNAAMADDLNAPDYRGDPLSVNVHYTGEASSGFVSLVNFSSVDDTDPSTFLYDIFPSEIISGENGRYIFEVPNFVDEMPIKYLRIQLTWQNVTTPPLGVNSEGVEGTSPVPGVVTFASNPLVFTQPDGGYQYFDLEYRPNPDYETISVQLAQDAVLVQAVIDSVSVPEPASLGLLLVGSLFAVRTKL
ncbi:PEP-CTERM sorting domain-containing protein [Limihaloglobus sulfuriphilus]|uniref:PEP-CTERM sorting domain-containing protein n=1 Tax=Limihaloglobus sulfuriphilus TaxID=1851148 RepID=UPI00164984A9|nr:PEP-CTERM sorting domain-containing protein [Limihaloglobus sulfuriphilus]